MSMKIDTSLQICMICPECRHTLHMIEMEFDWAWRDFPVVDILAVCWNGHWFECRVSSEYSSEIELNNLKWEKSNERR